MAMQYVLTLQPAGVFTVCGCQLKPMWQKMQNEERTKNTERKLEK